MNQELSKNLMCIVIRGGIEIWVEKEKAENIIIILEKKREKGFISINGQFINVADITGIFESKTMENTIRRKNGQWQCSCGEWIDKFQRCENCEYIEIPNYAKQWKK